MTGLPESGGAAPRPERIRVIAVCVFRRGDSILVYEAFDSVKGSPYYRALGGGVEPGETTQAAVAREIDEELGLEVIGLRLLGVLENRFVCDGEPGHEIVFVYDGRFRDESVHQRESLPVTESDGELLTARWRRLDWFDDYHRLVPEALGEMLAQTPTDQVDRRA